MPRLRVVAQREDRTVLRAIATISCPKCNAAAGAKCATPRGAMHGHTHRARILAFFKGA